MHHRHRLVAGMRPSRYLPQIDMGVEQLAQAQPDRQGGRQQQPGVGDQPLVVKRDRDFVGVVASHLTGVLLPASNGRLGSAILAGQRAPVAVSGRRSQSATGGSGLSWILLAVMWWTIKMDRWRNDLTDAMVLSP